MFPQKLGHVRHYARAVKLVRSGNDKKVPVVNYDDVSSLRSYLQRLDLNLLKPQRTRGDLSFKFTGQNLVKEMYDSLALYENPQPAEHKVDSQPARTRQSLQKLRAALQSRDETFLYGYLRRELWSKDAILVFGHLSPLEVSLIVRKLTDLMKNVIKWHISELQYISRVTNDSDMNRVLRTKSETFTGISKILRNLGKSHQFSTIDYEKIVDFYVNNLRYKSAIEMIAELEQNIKSGNEKLYFTRSLWNNKLKLLGHGDEKLWKLNRFSYKQAEVETIPRKYKYPHHGSTVQELLAEYEASGVLPNMEIYQTIALCLGRSGDIEFLQSLLDRVWGISSDSEPLFHPGQVLYPTSDFLEKILVAFTYNGQFLKGLVVCMNLIQKYKLDSNSARRFWTGSLRSCGITTKNIQRDLQHALWEQGADEEVYNQKEFELQHEMMDLLWTNAIGMVGSPSKEMIKIRLQYSSLDSLMKDLPQVHSMALNETNNGTASEAIYNESILTRYLNTCRIKLQQLHKYYEAEQVIKRFAVSKNMESELLARLRRSQQLYLRSNIEKVQQKIIDDDDDDGFGIW
ncbi:hypothetical protein OGAPHI_005651 [Ogataea philodendri]|uniref:ATPase expression protein 2, mitochondrial n=1 Tax=Ogataea philodendri TaxID=1378263 RepID=A0A9P8P0F9_9ASCO|nr:uncharacterized protein OGAPHI_005651 [Ogataea philodendri]KAH3662399.1 hypothetical protein OGAPHI_005651 [Ogataea philodendri]